MSRSTGVKTMNWGCPHAPQPRRRPSRALGAAAGLASARSPSGSAGAMRWQLPRHCSSREGVRAPLLDGDADALEPEELVDPLTPAFLAHTAEAESTEGAVHQQVLRAVDHDLTGDQPLSHAVRAPQVVG